jgi:hypothetical protein
MIDPFGYGVRRELNQLRGFVLTSASTMSRHRRPRAVLMSTPSSRYGLREKPERNFVMSKMVFTILAAVAEGERDRIRVNAGARLHRFPEQKCIYDADENVFERGFVLWASGLGGLVLGRVGVVAA